MTERPSVADVAIQKMHYNEVRTKHLSANISNVDTQGYRPSDLAAFDFKTVLGSTSSRAALAPSSTGNSLGAASNDPNSKKKFITVTSPHTGFALDEQLVKLNETYMDHRAAATIYQKEVDMMKEVLR